MTDKNMCASSCSLRSSKVVAIFGLIAVAFIVLLALSNWHLTIVQLFGYGWSLPLGALVIVSLIIGFLAGVSDYLSLSRSGKEEQIKGEWQAQDTKLIASVTSDREKQLEAKISTLEAALDKALKKE